MKLIAFAAGIAGLLVALAACSGGGGGTGGIEDSAATDLGDVDEGIIDIALETCIDRLKEEDDYRSLADGTLQRDPDPPVLLTSTEQIADLEPQRVAEEDVTAEDAKNGILAKHVVFIEGVHRIRFADGDWKPWTRVGYAVHVSEMEGGRYDTICWKGA